MARILFTADLEDGNIFSSFGLAKQLRQKGHDVVYVGVSDAEPVISAEGFGFFPLLQSSYPTGSKYSTGSFMCIAESRGVLCQLLMAKGAELDLMMKALSPSLIVVPPYLALESLILHLRYQLPAVHLRCAYIVESREEAISRSCNEILENNVFASDISAFLAEHGIDSDDLPALANRIASFPELVTLPEGYEPTSDPIRPNTYFIGATTDTLRKEGPFDWTLVDQNRHLIYCTLGSQSHRDAARSETFFRAVLDAVDGCDDWFLVMSVEKEMPANTLTYHEILTSWSGHHS